MRILNSIQDIISLQSEHGIVPAVQESAPVAQINPVILQPFFVNRPPKSAEDRGYQGFIGQGWRLALGMGANPMALTGQISILEGKKGETPWKMLIVR